MLYALARPLLFALEPETAHAVTMRAADWANACGALRWIAPRPPAAPVSALGLQFANPVGLAAGLDKNAEHIDALGALGFGFLEVGTVTPRPQPGNPRPRLFRLPRARALINRFGFNNVGLDRFLENVANARWRGVLGINIGKNADTPVEHAAADYRLGLERVYQYAGYVTVNISSPNTAGLRALQESAQLESLLANLAEARLRLRERHGKQVPLLLKVAPDLEPGQVQSIADAVRRHRFDGVIATNTTVSRAGVEGLAHAEEAGGLSGAPVAVRATAILAAFAKALAGEAVLVGAGGILSAQDAHRKRDAGATLVQLYTGLIYRGPGLIAECVGALR